MPSVLNRLSHITVAILHRSKDDMKPLSIDLNGSSSQRMIGQERGAQGLEDVLVSPIAQREAEYNPAPISPSRRDILKFAC